MPNRARFYPFNASNLIKSYFCTEDTVNAEHINIF